MATPTPCPTSEYRERYRACRYDSTTSALARLQSMSARELSQGATPGKSVKLLLGLQAADQGLQQVMQA